MADDSVEVFAANGARAEEFLAQIDPRLAPRWD